MSTTISGAASNERKELEAIKYLSDERKLFILNQLMLPHEESWIQIRTAEDAFAAIRSMAVRGAPAIAIVGALGVALDAWTWAETQPEATGFSEYASQKLDYIVGSRPTAVNLANAVCDLKKHLESRHSLLEAAVKMLADDIMDNRAIGENGLRWAQSQFSEPISVITICNTGSLATAGYGTALGIIRSLHSAGLLRRVYALETRPYLQGARLTSYELVHDGIPATLISDSMAASLMKQHPEIKMAIVGADRVAVNGDTANKIGTYALAVSARYHGVKFVVAAPTTSIDFGMTDGDRIRIEERPSAELTHIRGLSLAAPGIDVWNPAFDVTPESLIDAIVTEKGAFTPQDIRSLAPQ